MAQINVEYSWWHSYLLSKLKNAIYGIKDNIWHKKLLASLENVIYGSNHDVTQTKSTHGRPEQPYSWKIKRHTRYYTRRVIYHLNLLSCILTRKRLDSAISYYINACPYLRLHKVFCIQNSFWQCKKSNSCRQNAVSDFMF
jgi:hypothetical protein